MLWASAAWHDQQSLLLVTAQTLLQSLLLVGGVGVCWLASGMWPGMGWGYLDCDKRGAALTGDELGCGRFKGPEAQIPTCNATQASIRTSSRSASPAKWWPPSTAPQCAGTLTAPRPTATRSRCWTSLDCRCGWPRAQRIPGAHCAVDEHLHLAIPCHELAGGVGGHVP